MGGPTCANCGTKNEVTQKFCGECGSPLIAICTNGHENPPSQKFCGECGLALDATLEATSPTVAPTDQPGERRLVSVLFADLAGFTTFSENRDPEEVRSMLTHYFERSQLIIERFGGEVDKFIGDAITAFWGAHQIQEDDAERAVRAAVEMVRSVSDLGAEIGVPELALRVGVLSGEASVGPGGNEKGLVVGDIVNTAARLQGMADLGSVFVGESTRDLTAGAIRFESVGEKTVKGKSVPVPAWRVVDVVAEVGGRGRRTDGLEAPFVGREVELRMLKDQIHATTSDQRARLVSIIGEAGIGKSRLSWEMQKYLDGLTEVFRWHEGRSPAYGDGVTFWALGEMIRQRAGIASTDDTMKSRTKLRTMVAEFVPALDEQRWIEPRLAGVLGLDEMPAGDRNELFAALRSFFQRVAETGTEVLVFEDLHWADAGLLDFIEDLVERSPRHPILVVTLARPDLLRERPQWGTGRRGLLATQLGPLSGTHMTELVEGLAPGISREVVSLIVDRAEGIPLYGVEFVRMLMGSGNLIRSGDNFETVGSIDDLAIPDSLRSVIAARLDRLDPGLRDLLQDASVLGYSFPADGLEIFGPHPRLEDELRELVHHELLELDADERSPERGQYRFIQALIREVAYGGLALADRRDRHVRVAEHYEGLEGVEYAAIVASHYVDAFAADASPDLARRTRHALQKAAERAAQLHSNQQVLELARRAIELTPEGSDLAALHQLTARAADGLADYEEAVVHAHAALDWHRAHGDPADVTRAAALLGQIHGNSSHPVQAIEAMAPYYDPSADSLEQAVLAAELGRAQFLNSQGPDSLPIIERALVLAEKHRDTPALADAMVTKASLLQECGRVQEGLVLLKGAIEYAEQNELAFTAGRALNNLMVHSEMDGDLAVGDYVLRGLEMGTRRGDANTIERMRAQRAHWLMTMYRFDDALDVLDQDTGYELDAFAPHHPYVRGMVDWMRTGSAEAFQAAHDAADIYRSAEQPQTRETGRDFQAWMAFVSRDHRVALDEALEVDPTIPWGSSIEAALMSALAMGEGGAVERATEYATRWPYPGRKKDAHDALMAAGTAMLERGRDDHLIDAVSGLIAIYDDAFSIDRRVQSRLWFATLIGSDRPEAQEAARAATTQLEAAGAHHLLALWSDVVARPSAEVAS